MNEELRYQKTRKDGRVECVNIWATGWQELVVANETAFYELKKKIELEGYVPRVSGYHEDEH
jgi:hypothetical protein